MYKRCYFKLKVLVASLIFVFFPTTIVFAEDKASDVLSTPLEYSKAINYLEYFTSKAWFGDDWFGLSSEMLYLINSFVQAVFWLTKLIFSTCALIYDKLTTGGLLDEYIQKAINASASFYQSFVTSLVPFIGGAMAIYIVYVYFVKNGNLVPVISRFILTFGIVTILFSQYNGQYVLYQAYKGTTEITANLATTIMSKKITFSDESGFAKQSDKEAVLTEYFNQTIWKPYRFMNADVDKNSGNGFNLTDKDLIALLDYESGDDDFKIGDKQIKSIAGDISDPKVKMLKNAWGKKFTYAVGSLIDVTVLGIVLDIFAISSFVLGLIFIVLVILGALATVLALFPTMDNILSNLLKKMFIVIVLSGLMTFFSILFLGFYSILSLVADFLFSGNLFLSAILKVIVLIIVWKNRDQLVSLLTANRVTAINNNFTRRFSNVGERFKTNTMGRMKENAMSKLALAGVTVAGAKKMTQRKALSHLKKNAGQVKNGFNNKIAQVRAKKRAKKGEDYNDALTDVKRQQELRLEKMANVGRRASGIKHKSHAYLARMQAEGYKERSQNDLFERSRERAEQHEAIALERRQQVAQSNQRISNQQTLKDYQSQKTHNEQTKERLQGLREKRLADSGKINKGKFNQKIAENKIRSQLRKKRGR